MATQTVSAAQFFRDLDSRAMPRYTFGEAARYLGLPESTVRAWFSGMPYGRYPDVQHFAPILKPAAPDLLSFYDIVSAHVLMSIKAQRKKREEKRVKQQREHPQAKPPKIVTQNDLREIVQNLAKEYPDSPYPLLGRNFFLFGRDVIIKQIGKRLNLSSYRQLGLKQVMDKFLDRVEVDANLMPTRFSPLRSQKERGRGFIVIDPDLAAGRPVVKNTGIPAEIIFKRKKAGESVARLATDYHISRRAIEEAIEYYKAA